MVLPVIRFGLGWSQNYQISICHGWLSLFIDNYDLLVVVVDYVDVFTMRDKKRLNGVSPEVVK